MRHLRRGSHPCGSSHGDGAGLSAADLSAAHEVPPPLGSIARFRFIERKSNNVECNFNLLFYFENL
jgi:hypothetical protein